MFFAGIQYNKWQHRRWLHRYDDKIYRKLAMEYIRRIGKGDLL